MSQRDVDQAIIRAAARALLENHVKLATCKRAAGKSREYMVGVEAAVDIVSDLIVQRDRARAEGWDEGHSHCFHVEDPRQSSRNPHWSVT